MTADKTILKPETSELHQAQSFRSGLISIQKSRGLSGLIRKLISGSAKLSCKTLQEISVSG